MNTVSISIIVPIYNTASFLNRCLDSLLEQTFTDFEVLMVDDGSTDHSKDICMGYLEKDQRFNYQYKENGGLSSARNHGIANANGTYIFFLDSDDHIVPTALRICFETASKNKTELLNFGYQYIKGNEKESHPSFLPKNRLIGHDEILKILEKNTLHNKLLWFSWSYFYNTNFLKTNRLLFNEALLLGEDSDFNLRCLLYAEKVFSIVDCIYCYVYNPHSLTQRNYRKKLLEKYQSQFQARMKVYNDFRLTNTAYKQDISQNYLEHALFELIYNERNNPDQLSLIKIVKEMRKTSMFEYCAENYRPSKQCTVKKKLLIQLFIYKQWRLMSFILKKT